MMGMGKGGGVNTAKWSEKWNQTAKSEAKKVKLDQSNRWEV